MVHETPSAGTLDHRYECVEYCKNDVLVLALGMRAYRNIALEASGCDPLLKSTAAGSAMQEFLERDYGPRQLAVLKPHEISLTRKAFYGGRTEIFTPLYELSRKQISDGWVGRYDDLISLYPSVQIMMPTPYGPPKMHGPVADRLHDWIMHAGTGFVQVDVTPPDNLLHPILPTRVNDHVLFGLEEIKDHVYTLIEMRCAISHGYEVARIYEGMTFACCTDMFTSYMTRNLRNKILCSSVPADALTYCKELKERIGIIIEPSEFKKNPGLKTVSKLKCNSLWGKLAERTHPKRMVVTRPQYMRKLEMHRAGRISIEEEEAISANEIALLVKDFEDTSSSYRTNISLAAHVTANGRMRL